MKTLFLHPWDDFVYTAAVDDADGANYDLAGCTLWFTVKRRLSDSDANAIAKLYWVSGGASSGITVPTPANGGAVIRMTPSQTDDFLSAAYRWDLQLMDSAGVVRSVDDGVLVVRKRVTERVTTP